MLDVVFWLVERRFRIFIFGARPDHDFRSAFARLAGLNRSPLGFIPPVALAFAHIQVSVYACVRARMESR